MPSQAKHLTPRALGADLELAFLQTRETAGQNTNYEKVIKVVNTSSDSKQLIFFGDKGRMRRFRGERQPQGFAEYKTLATLDKWEMTISVNREVLDDDQTGGNLRDKVTSFASAVESSREAETWEFLRNGASLKGFDKANLFDFNHYYVTSSGVTVGATTLGGPGVQANMHLGGSQIDATTMQITQQWFTSIKTDKNKPYGARLTDVVVVTGSLNHKAAKELSNSTFTVEASTAKGQMAQNVFQGAFNIIDTVYGLGASEWIALDLSESLMKPIFVLSHSVSPGFNNMAYTQLLEDSETGFWKDVFAFGVLGRFDWNVGDWRTAFLYGSSAYTFVPYDSESQRLADPNA